jgi:hypothetical protein
MRTSLNEIQQIERFLLNQLSGPDKLVFEARVLTNPSLRIKAVIQQKLQLVIKAFHRKQQKQELLAIHHKLFSHPDKVEFQERVLRYFN